HPRPLSPLPPSAPTSIPTPSVASSYLSAGHAEGYGRQPRTPTTSSPLPSQYEYSSPQNPATYPPPSQYISEPGRSHPAFPTDQLQTHASPTHTDLPSRAHRGVTMPVPELHNNTNVAPGLHPDYPLQAPSITHSQSYPGMLGAHHIPIDRHRDQYDSYHGGDWDGHDNSATHSSGAISRAPPTYPVAGTQGNSIRPSNSHFDWARRIVHRRNQPQSQTMTPAPPVTTPQPATFRCRLRGCDHPITGDVATRLNGFCCNSHRDIS
ncbi:hypothetical protein EDB87DRAFT_1646752, partial [Lactarius vividus]